MSRTLYASEDEASGLLAYKIVEEVGGNLLTLFHAGHTGTRVVPRDVWIRAHEAQVRDGSGQRTYLSGHHIFLSRIECEAHLDKFRVRRERLRVVPCLVQGIRHKAHSPAPVMLARWIKFSS